MEGPQEGWREGGVGRGAHLAMQEFHPGKTAEDKSVTQGPAGDREDKAEELAASWKGSPPHPPQRVWSEMEKSAFGLSLGLPRQDRQPSATVRQLRP